MELEIDPELDVDVAVVATSSDLGKWGGEISSDVVVDVGDVDVDVGDVGNVGDVGRVDKNGGGGDVGGGGVGIGEKGVGGKWLEGVESVEGWRTGRLGKRATWCG